MKVLVTGGAGFVGAHLVDALLARGDEVVVVDHWRREKKRFLDPRAKIYKMAIGDPALRDVFLEEKPDYVCHLAAQIAVTKSVADPIHDAQMNIVDPIHLLACAKEAGVKKVIFSSSGAAIYGDHKTLPTPELYDTHPVSPYGVSKQAFEHYLRSFHGRHGLPYTSLRFANIFGPRQMADDKGEGAVIAIFLKKIRDGEPVTIFGDGSATRDYVFVGDAVRAFLAAMDADFVGEVNISTGVETSVMDLWRTLQKIHVREHQAQHAPDRPGEIYRCVLDPSLAKTAIAWQPETSFEDGLRATYEWFMNHAE